MAPPVPQSKAVPRLLAALGVVLLGLLAWRAYSPRYYARPTEASTTAKAIDLNRADRVELLQVPGVGPHMANAILARRSELGRFESLEELDSVHGIGPKTVEKLRGWLTIAPGSPRTFAEPVEKLERKRSTPAAPVSTGRINVNTAGIEQLNGLPAIGPKLAERIIAERAKQPFATVEDLRRVSGIGAKTIEKLRPLVKFAD